MNAYWGFAPCSFSDIRKAKGEEIRKLDDVGVLRICEGLDVQRDKIGAFGGDGAGVGILRWNVH